MLNSFPLRATEIRHPCILAQLAAAPGLSPQISSSTDNPVYSEIFRNQQRNYTALINFIVL